MVSIPSTANAILNDVTLLQFRYRSQCQLVGSSGMLWEQVLSLRLL